MLYRIESATPMPTQYYCLWNPPARSSSPSSNDSPSTPRTRHTEEPGIFANPNSQYSRCTFYELTIIFPTRLSFEFSKPNTAIKMHYPAQLRTRDLIVVPQGRLQPSFQCQGQKMLVACFLYPNIRERTRYPY
ncbi:hypothetical protein Moror_3786 [Moniliophthora roreri MCA 2997]|uniref:Uncharacterized protein n=1 Tax=Moniliophthora roreri (strain MCA 2997) TaxID=1381753 RepID=V2WRR2_MONRO|nr:hypothetical protein Moror_3786 [Moniliophthora roreri MCA 2997]